MMNTLLDLPSALKVRIASFLTPRDAVRVSKSCKNFYNDLSLTQIPLKIPFKSWYEDSLPGATAMPHPKHGPKIPFLPNRTHSVTLTGSWSCRLGELQGRQCGTNPDAQFYIVAYPVDQESSLESDLCGKTNRKPGGRNEEEEGFFNGGRVVWASSSLFQRHNHPSNSNSSWVKLTVTFYPVIEEEYYLCIQPGPGAAVQRFWRHSLHLSNLIAHVTFHDDPHSNFLMKRQYRTIVKHMNQVDNRGAYYTKILEAVARSIRIQLARFGRNALDPMLESFFESTGIPRDTDSLLVLEEVARFLSHYAYVNERQKMNLSGDRESAKGGSNSNRDSIPDWIPYEESSIANKSNSDLNHLHNSNAEELLGDGSSLRQSARVAAHPAIEPVREQVSKPRRDKFSRTVQGLWKIPSFLKRSSLKKKKRASWRSDEMITEEFSISVVQPEEITRPLD